MVGIIHHITEVIMRFDHGLMKASVVFCNLGICLIGVANILLVMGSTAQLMEKLLALEKIIFQISISLYIS